MKTQKPKKESLETSYDGEPQTLKNAFSIYDVPDAVLTAREIAYELAAHSDSTVKEQAEAIISALSKCIKAMGKDDIGKVAA